MRDDWSQPTRYERWYESSLGRAYGACIAAVLRPWLAELRGVRVLDVGCGPGLVEAQLLPQGCDLWGLDCSEPAAHRALARSREIGRPATLVVGSVVKMPLADATFDVVVSLNCLEFVPDRREAFAELSRVLKSGGMLILAVLNRRGPWELSRRIWRPFTSRTYYQGRFFTRRELTECCESAGLQGQTIVSAVHLPPLPLGPLWAFAESIDQFARRIMLFPGSVLLCRARKA
jgi:SAM-dependent methyltransferase